MLRLQAFKCEMMPTGEQQRQMRGFAGSCCFVFNQALVLEKARHKRREKNLGYAGLCKLLTEWRNGPQMPWLKHAPCHPLQQALQELQRAYANFFAKRAGFPRFKKKSQGDRLRYPDPKQFEIDQAHSRIKLPQLGWMRYRNSRDIPGVARNMALSECGGKWYASIQTEREMPQPVPTATTAIGIDVGIERFATLSDGSFIAPLNSFKKHQLRLRVTSGEWRARSNSARTGKRKKPKFKRCTHRLPTPAKISCTSPHDDPPKPRARLY